MRSYAVLVDGGFIKHKLGNSKKPMTAQDVEDFIKRLSEDPCLKGMQLHRVYYYDSAPLTDVVKKPLDGGDIDFGASALAKYNRDLHLNLGKLKFFALRFGELVFHGWLVRRSSLPETGKTVSLSKSDLIPEIRQKGVDMRIGLDIAALTLKKHAQVIVLVTGDSDFVPAMKFARREGAQLYLAPLGHGVKPSMIEHSDVLLDTK